MIEHINFIIIDSFISLFTFLLFLKPRKIPYCCYSAIVILTVYVTIPTNTNADYSMSNHESNNSNRAKSKLGFLENLNAKLAEQKLSGKAFAVRNIINSKALVRTTQRSFFLNSALCIVQIFPEF